MTTPTIKEVPSRLRVWEDDEIAAEVQDMKRSLLDEGWDDVIFYRYEEADISVQSLMYKLLNQKTVIDVSQAYKRREVVATGVPVTFGGLKVVKNPDVARITSFKLYDPDNKELEEVATGLVYVMLTESFEKADTLAKDFIREYNGGIIPSVVQGFYYSLTPVMCREEEDGAEETRQV